MLSKLAVSNVKKSIRDYMVYFMTLAFGICIFYVFNSIESQRAMLKISDTQNEVILKFSELIGYVSVFISVILGFLIIYANRFLIKRRKKELGIYMTLGMEKGTISRILVLETLIIGIVSLAAGLIIGIFISQGLSVITAKLFAADMKAFIFVFSKTAFLKSIIYFGIIYLVVILFNTFSISKYKLIDLINAGRKNENPTIKRLWAAVVLFLASALCLGIAYTLIIKVGLSSFGIEFWTSIALGIVGTLLFFMSLSGFLLQVVKQNRSIYLKDLNMFVLRQLNNKINTAFVSMSMICLMLFIAISALASGLSVADIYSQRIIDVTPFDATMQRVDFRNEGIRSIVEDIKKDSIISFDKIAKEYLEVKLYNTSIMYRELMIGGMEEIPNLSAVESMKNTPVPLMTLTDYNKILLARGIKPVSLKDNEFLINYNNEIMPKVLHFFMDNKGTIELNGRRLTALKGGLLNYTLKTHAAMDDRGTIIVSDKLLSGTKAQSIILNIKYRNAEHDEELLRSQIKDGYGMEKEKPFHWLYTKKQVYENSKGVSATATYLAIYIGLVFLITGAAVLALQQLSETTDNVERYGLLRKLGAEEKMIKKALFVQILIYFAMPLSLAVIHSVVGIKVANDVIEMAGNINISWNAVMISGIFIMVYGGYFAATYISSKNILRSM